MSDQLELAPEWQAWLCTNLLGGERVQDLIDALADEGVSESVARDAIHAIQRSPLFSAARDFALRTRRAEQILLGIRSRSRLLKIERRDSVDGEGFHQHIRAAGRPVVLSDFTKDWPARRWTFADLKARFGDAEVQVMEGRDGDPDYDRNHAPHTSQTT